jgi:hypothetical protein
MRSPAHAERRLVTASRTIRNAAIDRRRQLRQITIRLHVGIDSRWPRQPIDRLTTGAAEAELVQCGRAANPSTTRRTSMTVDRIVAEILWLICCVLGLRR